MQKLGWIKLQEKRKLHKLVLLHRLMRGMGPKPLMDKLPDYKNHSSASTRGAASGNFFIPRFRTDYIKKSFFYDVITSWNKLPVHLREIDNSKTFKERLQNHMLRESALVTSVLVPGGGALT